MAKIDDLVAEFKKTKQTNQPDEPVSRVDKLVAEFKKTPKIVPSAQPTTTKPTGQFTPAGTQQTDREKQIQWLEKQGKSAASLMQANKYGLVSPSIENINPSRVVGKMVKAIEETRKPTTFGKEIAIRSTEELAGIAADPITYLPLPLNTIATRLAKYGLEKVAGKEIPLISKWATGLIKEHPDLGMGEMFTKLFKRKPTPTETKELNGIETAIEKEATKAPESLTQQYHATQKAIDENFDNIVQGKMPVDYNKIPKPKSDEILFTKIKQSLKEVKPLRTKQEAIYHQVRSERLGRALAVGEEVPGEAGHYVMKGQLGGEIDKVEFESVRNKFSQPEVDRLFQLVKESPDLKGYEKINAGEGLARLFGEMGGVTPRKSEIALLEKVFPPDVIKSIIDKRGWFQKAKDLGMDIANIPRAIMSSCDLSASFRQGLFMSSRKEFYTAFGSMVKSFGSEKSFQALQESILKNPNYQLMNESGLQLTNLAVGMEERFSSQLAEKIPVVGRAVRASDRAYTGFLNKVRADVFNDLVGKAEKLGLKPQENLDLTKQIAKFVNVGTGRGDLGILQSSANTLNAFFFSPRLMASRLTLLNPAYYIKADPFVRKEALKSLFTLTGAVVTVNALAKAAGAKVTVDPRNADFGKIKIGNTRIDMMGGFQQYIRAAAQLITGKMISSTTGKEYTLGEGYKAQTRLDILARNIEYKEAPIFSFATNLIRGKTAFGEDVKIKDEIAMRFQPMMSQDIQDIVKDDPGLLPIVVGADIVGFGVQTYKEQTPRERALAAAQKEKEKGAKIRANPAEERKKKMMRGYRGQ